MTPQEITDTLQDLFGANVTEQAATSWQVEMPDFRLLILLSEDQSWLRVLLPIAPIQEAEPFFKELLEANFDTTLETRYALHQNVLWGVFQDSFVSLNVENFTAAINTLMFLYQQGLSPFYDSLIESRIRQIIQVSKSQGQSMESTLQTLERFYAEGLMGEMAQSSVDREQTLAAWRYQLERLWPEV